MAQQAPGYGGRTDCGPLDSPKVFAPWTPKQVEAANRFQQDGKGQLLAVIGNPNAFVFTCPTDALPLYATVEGWHCSLCAYACNWAHDFMLRAEDEKPYIDSDTWRALDDRAEKLMAERGISLATALGIVLGQTQAWCAAAIADGFDGIDDDVDLDDDADDLLRWLGGL